MNIKIKTIDDTHSPQLKKVFEPCQIQYSAQLQVHEDIFQDAVKVVAVDGFNYRPCKDLVLDLLGFDDVDDASCWQLV